MTKLIDTFSSNSLKLLDKSPLEFKNKYIYNLYLSKKDQRALLGQKFHNLISTYIKGVDTQKIALELTQKETKTWEKLKNYLKDKKQNFIKTEYSFLTKEKLNNSYYYLTGRFDAIYKKNDEYIIYDWKTLNIPKDAESDLQTIVYLYCFSEIAKSEKIKMRYLSIETLEAVDIEYKDKKIYKKRIDDIIQKI